MSRRPNTKEWAASKELCIDETVPAVDGYTAPCGRTAEDVAIRAVILHCVAAVGYGVDPAAIVQWLNEQAIWDQVSPKERALLRNDAPSEKERSDARWRQEAEWALLWAIGRVESLGLPTRTCDTGKLVNEIMPALGEPIATFVSSAQLRPPSELLAEDDRVYNLHCYARQAYREGTIPEDLLYDVLFQRHHAFAWLQGDDDWDRVRTDT